ncbi:MULTISPECIES: GFA family protein [Rhizobium/Agrobacterium group]|uniref:GFA family protein n=1 Tax=Rhizobium/Agrobacterium group TaxID=227290 RepID=UPI000B404088|nr:MULTISPECIES: GFA family protein [Rhizobium/Agrobacterium group]MCF1459939.1 GFA family protein [Allorhizobium ampelinum]MCF1482019.1 GFA family protein [Allorhizobium ampelinum]NSZ42207.1 GFA family protein [Agrobacterium vitis]NTA25915.1 GFA family protein [Allorhizobium ampelinum]OVE95993.1 aldehyde-activating protein [Allorhizobium ampelinum]
MKGQTLHGGCQCGAVRYTAKSPIGNPHICHCRMCQKASGNYFLPLGSVNRDLFQLTRGAPHWFQSSDLVRRGFCTACGTPLFFDIPEADFINITLGSLDDPASVKPVEQANLDSKMPWFAALDTLPVEASEANADWLAKVAGATHQHPDHDTSEWPTHMGSPHD